MIGMIEKPGNDFVRQFRRAIDALKGCVTPLFHLTDSGKPKLLASSFLVKISDTHFLCTAKHVLERAESPFYINGLSTLEILTGDFYCSRQHDMTVLRLTPEQVLSFGKYTFLSEDQIANAAQTKSCSYVEFIGYPATRNPVSKTGYPMTSRLYTFGCIAHQISLEEVRFRFTKKNVDATSRLRVRSPNPHGVSGGPIMGISLKNKSTIMGHAYPRLIGIATDYNEKSNEVFGPTAAVLIAIIKKAWGVVLPPRFGR